MRDVVPTTPQAVSRGAGRAPATNRPVAGRSPSAIPARAFRIVPGFPLAARYRLH